MEPLDRHGKLIARYIPEVTPAEAKVALGMLDALKTRPEHWQPKTAYNREKLKLSWAKIADRSGQDVKDLVLARQMEWDTRVYDNDGYTLRYGVIPADPYTGQRIVFEQAPKDAAYAVQIDHVVSIADAYRSGGWDWQIGGYNWTGISNDPANLLAVPASVNDTKSDKTADHWLPPKRANSFRKRFIVLQITVKTRYNLTVTDAERDAMRGELQR